MGEIWRDVPGWEGFYAVSNLGRIKRLAGSPRCNADRVLKLKQNTRGYLTYAPVRSGVKQTNVVVHRVVLHAFVGPPPIGKETANHINGIKTDNRLENLEWVTHAQNIKHAYDNGLHGIYKGSAASAALLSDSQVTQILKMSASGMRHRQISEALGIGFRSIADIVAGKTYTNVARPETSKYLPKSRKLNIDQIIEIKQMLAADKPLSAKEIGERFGVSAGMIQGIKHGRTWHHITPPKS